ncbi:MAG: CoA pyrophosphatase [Desulfobacterota bacterium]|nr:CoA pyrophosphatase [Thermodesulfobacteriota bacterium]
MIFEKIKKIISQRSRKVIEDKNLIPAAVLILLYKKANKVYLLFTRRTDKVASHKGEISFPGGVREHKNEPPELTALREAQEEVGINPHQVEILGLLDDCITVSTNYVITPVVGVSHSLLHFKINPEEVDEVIEIPLSFFQSALQQKPPSPSEFFLAPITFNYGNYHIWGATARILNQFLELLKK